MKKNVSTFIKIQEFIQQICMTDYNGPVLELEPHHKPKKKCSFKCKIKPQTQVAIKYKMHYKMNTIYLPTFKMA